MLWHEMRAVAGKNMAPYHPVGAPSRCRKVPARLAKGAGPAKHTADVALLYCSGEIYFAELFDPMTRKRERAAVCLNLPDRGPRRYLSLGQTARGENLGHSGASRGRWRWLRTIIMHVITTGFHCSSALAPLGIPEYNVRPWRMSEHEPRRASR